MLSRLVLPSILCCAALLSAVQQPYTSKTDASINKNTEQEAVIDTIAYRDCPDCPLMMSIEGGTYTMGSLTSEKDRSDDECPHTETVANFSIGVYEVTVAEYLRFADATNSHYPEWLEKGSVYNVETGTNSHYKDKGYSRAAGTLPVCGVSWHDAVAYCEWMSKKTGKKYRLPLEKEWEYAAKGGKKTRGYKYAGSNDLSAVAWCSSNAGSKPHAVGGKAANELGLYDMSGNLWEWCQDKWAAYPGCTASDCANCAVLRGGSWYNNVNDCRASYRNWNGNANRYYYYGFRCARDGK
jgi:formylglycine-generating enzyme